MIQFLFFNQFSPEVKHEHCRNLWGRPTLFINQKLLDQMLFFNL